MLSFKFFKPCAHLADQTTQLHILLAARFLQLLVPLMPIQFRNVEVGIWLVSLSSLEINRFVVGSRWGMLLPARLNSLLLHDSDGSRANHGTLLFLALLNHSVVYWVSVLRAQLSQRSPLLILKLDIWKLQRRQFIFQEHTVQLRQITSPNLRVKGFVQATCLVGPRDRLVCYLLRHWEVRYCHTLRQVRVQFGYVARVPGLLQLFVDGVPPACTNLVKLQTYLALRSTSGKRLTCCTLGLMFWICFFCCSAFRC